MQVRRARPASFWLISALFLSLAASFFPLSALAERVEDLPKPTDYVSDFAQVLSPEEVARLDNLCSQLDHSAANAQVAIVTVKNLDGDDQADFANRLEERWKVGKKGSDRGILMLVSTEDRHYWIEVGYGLEGILPDARVGDIGRMMVPELHQGLWDGALNTGLVQIADVIAADAKVTLQDEPQVNQEYQAQPVRRGSSFAGLIFRLILIVLVLAFFGVRGLFGFGLGMFLGGGGRRGGWGGGGGGWGGGGGGGGGGFGGFGGGSSGGGGAGGSF